MGRAQSTPTCIQVVYLCLPPLLVPSWMGEGILPLRDRLRRPPQIGAGVVHDIADVIQLEPSSGPPVFLRVEVLDVMVLLAEPGRRQLVERDGRGGGVERECRLGAARAPRQAQAVACRTRPPHRNSL